MRRDDAVTTMAVFLYGAGAHAASDRTDIDSGKMLRADSPYPCPHPSHGDDDDDDDSHRW